MKHKSSPPPHIPIAQVHGFDRLTIAIDRPTLPGPLAKLKAVCASLVLTPGRMQYNPVWQAKVELYQPAPEALTVLVDECLRDQVGALPTYAEFTWDLIFSKRRHAREFHSWLLERVVIRHQRADVRLETGTAYFQRRTITDGTKRSRVAAAYCDRPSKLSSVHAGQPCVHIEIRVQGSDTLAAVGISSVSEFAELDHAAFWASTVTLLELPPPTRLGRILGGRQGSQVSGSALRKRAEKLIAASSVEGQFCMHNAARRDKAVMRRFPRLSLETVMALRRPMSD